MTNYVNPLRPSLSIHNSCDYADTLILRPPPLFRVGRFREIYQFWGRHIATDVIWVLQAAGKGIVNETAFGNSPDYQLLAVPFNSGANTSITVWVGFWGQDTTQWLRVDDVGLEQIE